MSIIAQSRDLARTLHASQVRRESRLPFFGAHLEPVAQMVEANGGDAMAIAAAYLHDAIEDIGPHTREQIAAISPELLSIVEQLTEQGETWEEEKQGYVEGVAHMDERALLVSMCDKYCNARDFVEEWKQGKFGKRPGQIIWFFDALIDAYGRRARALGREYPYIELDWDLAALVGRMQEIYNAVERKNHVSC